MQPPSPAASNAHFRALGAGLCFAAACYNLWQSWTLFGQFPLSDPASYPALAQASRWFYDSGIREPLPVFLTKLGMLSGLAQDFAVRLPALVVAAASGPVLCALTWPLFGGPAAYAAGLLLALNPWLGFYACAGSSSIYSAFFFSVFLLVLLDKNSALKTALLAGVAGGLAALSRLESLGAAAGVCALYPLLQSFAPKKSFPFTGWAGFDFSAARKSALALAVCVLLALPYILYQKAEFGSFLHSHGVHARFWLNAAQGVPPGPQRYEPGPASPSSLILRDGALAAPGLLARGYWTALRRTPDLLRSGFVFAAAIFGAVCAVAYLDAALVPFALALALFPVAPIMNLDQAGPRTGVEMRFLFHTLWLWCLCAGLALEAVLRLKRARQEKLVPIKPVEIPAVEPIMMKQAKLR